ncbi:MAG TPA: cupredoxin domain-containing protein [Roseiflexaceae bacterium]|nr:cupredoxin domain-containing protein [Roseiflexaceae bacterium]
MRTTILASRSHSQYPLAALGKVVVAALVGVALLLIYVQVLIFGTFVLPLTICVIISVVVAGIIALGWRWAPLLGTIWILLAIVLNAEGMRYDLTHPEQLHSFAWQVSMDALLLGGVVAGIAATMQNYRSRAGDRSRPRWLPYGMTALIALAIGAIVSAAIPRAEAAAGIDTKLLNQLPALAAHGIAFDQTEVDAKVGGVVALRLDNFDSIDHQFDIDALDVHAAMPVGKRALSLFTPARPGTYTFYCSVPGHRAAGMVGALIVAP